MTLAEGVGFSVEIRTSIERAGDEEFSVCVAAPAFDYGDRYRPFNHRRGPSSGLMERNAQLLAGAAGALSPGGLMFVYGLPAHLPRYASALTEELAFRYWVAVRAMTARVDAGLRPEHTGLLVLSRPGAALNRIRIPHASCRSCGEALKDWGGKSHLMHPRGVALSDVWMDLVVDPRERIPAELFERILQLSANEGRARLLLVVPDEPAPAEAFGVEKASLSSFNPLAWKRPAAAAPKGPSAPQDLLDRLHRAPCLEMLKAIPSETVDLAFADPPFNLTKNYNGYSDSREASDYLGWCKRWLVEYERVLKPGGALVIVNLPKWAVRLADFLSRASSLFFQSWIVWASLPEPKGVLMPAHYSLLYYTKGERASHFNYCSMENGWEPFDEAVFPPDRADVCQRRSCVKRRRASGHIWRGELTDIWYDIHRDRRGRRAAIDAAHPCRTPERLIDRIIRLTTPAGGLVLDAFAGVGTTALVARRLGRHFIAIEQDVDYLRAAERRMNEQPLTSRRQTERSRGLVSKRALQLELKRIALELGRLPTKAEAGRLSRYELTAFESAFTSWSAALKAARVAADELPRAAAAQEAAGHAQLEMFREKAAGALHSRRARAPLKNQESRVANAPPRGGDLSDDGPAGSDFEIN